MIAVNEERTADGLVYTNISLTRGNDATLVMPIYVTAADGSKTEYAIQPSDTFKLEVRTEPITRNSATPPAPLFTGTVSIVDGKPNWIISSTNSTQNTGIYYWDVEITTGGKTYTFYQGKFIICPNTTE